MDRSPDETVILTHPPQPGSPSEPVATDRGVVTTNSALPVDHTGTTVHLTAWQGGGDNRWPVLFVHDLGEQSLAYAEAGFHFVQHGFGCYAFDLRGHGRSGRRLGHAPSFHVLVKDLLQVAAWIRHAEGGRAPVIIGHGVGALILADFTKYHGAFCQAAVLSAPCFELAAPVSLPGRMALRFLAEAAPTIRLPRALLPRFAAVPRSQDIDDDEALPFPRLTAIFAHELVLALARSEARFLEYQGATLVLCPERDDICAYHHVKKSVALHTGHNLELADLPGTGHAVFTEDAARASALAVILPWLERALRSAPLHAPGLPET